MNGKISGSISVGGIVGENSFGTIQQVNVNATITGKSDLGGITGSTLGGKIIESTVNGTIQENENKNGNSTGNVIGGISGKHSLTTITDNLIKADLLGYRYIGGINGFSTSQTSYHNIFTGNIKGTLNVDFMNGFQFEYYDLPKEKMNDKYNLFLGSIDGYDHKIDNVLFSNNTSIMQHEIPENKLITNEQLKDKNWYITTFGLSETIWNFDSLEQEHPTLQWLMEQ